MVSFVEDGLRASVEIFGSNELPKSFTLVSLEQVWKGGTLVKLPPDSSSDHASDHEEPGSPAASPAFRSFA